MPSPQLNTSLKPDLNDTFSSQLDSSVKPKAKLWFNPQINNPFISQQSNHSFHLQPQLSQSFNLLPNDSVFKHPSNYPQSKESFSLPPKPSLDSRQSYTFKPQQSYSYKPQMAHSFDPNQPKMGYSIDPNQSFCIDPRLHNSFLSQQSCTSGPSLSDSFSLKLDCPVRTSRVPTFQSFHVQPNDLFKQPINYPKSNSSLDPQQPTHSEQSFQFKVPQSYPFNKKQPANTDVQEQTWLNPSFSTRGGSNRGSSVHGSRYSSRDNMDLS